MSADRDVSRIVRSWLHEDAHEDADRLLDLVLDELDTTPQRGASWLARRFPPMNSNFVRVALVAAAVVVIAVSGYNLLPGLGIVGPGATPSPSQAPSPSVAQTAVADFPSFPGPPRPVEAGTYDLGPEFPVSVSFVVPAGWLSCVNNARLLCLADGVGGVTIDIVTNVVADPCKTTLRDPSVGPTVDDLVTAISSLPWSAVTPPTDVTVDGIRGKEFEVTAPSGSACAGDAFAVWVATLSGRVHEVSPGERNRLRILEVQGTRVVIAGSYRPGTTSLQDLAEINAIIDSVRIEPPGG